MAGHTRARTSRTHFMQAVHDELNRFERSEEKFRKQERAEHARRLAMPVDKYDREDFHVRKLSNPLRKL